MINKSKKIMILIKGSDLHTMIITTLRFILEIFKDSHRCFKLSIKKTLDLFIELPIDKIEYTINECYAYITHKSGNAHHLQLKRERTIFSTLTKTDCDQAKTVLRLLFIHLHKHGAVILTYNFTRPRGSITSIPDKEKLFYCETIHPYLELESTSPHISGTGKRTYTSIQRTWQTGIKMILMTSFFRPEDVSASDLQDLRIAQLKNNTNQFTPIPVAAICELLCQKFSERISSEVHSWLEVSVLAKDTPCVLYSSGERYLQDLLGKEKCPFMIASALTEYRRFGVSSFSCDTLDTYHLERNIYGDQEPFHTAMRIWTKAQQAYFYHQKLQKPKNARLAIGKINIYLFVYLPLWISQNPHSKFRYPDTPSKFTASVHYNCDAIETKERPLSLCELFRLIGYAESNASQAQIRTFFEYLIRFGDELEGCNGVKQPVRNLPPSKNYDSVTKNVFTGEQLRQFIAYHNALHAGAEFYLSTSSDVKTAVENARLRNTHVDTVDLGFVPVMYHEGKVSYIRRLHPDTFHFVTHDHAPYYNPGSVIFSLFLLECGVRGQTAQWLDAETYDRISQRLSRESLQLTTLWLNTDKVHKIPVIIVTTMANLWLLDDQRRWRKFMIDVVGVRGFMKKVLYDHEPTSHWGKILPLFAANPLTGDPFTDGKYKRLWNHHCLNFQNWFKDNTREQQPIVGFLPLRKNSTKKFFTWEEWIEGINVDDVLVVTGKPANKTYQGDYCPIALRAYSTPHGARASFITDMSINLPPEAVALLTGQSLSTIIKYNKGHHLLRDRLQGAFNNRDAAWFLTNSVSPTFSMAEARDRIQDSAKQGTTPSNIIKLGLHSFPTSTSPREMTGLKLIATDRSLSLGASYTHICPYNFICPEQILKKFSGQKRCAQCPFAVFSTHNLPAIEAHRQKVAEEYLSTIKIINKYSASAEVSTAEVNRLQEEAKNSAKEVISWMLVEEILWAKVEMQQDPDQDMLGKDLVVSDSGTVIKELSRSEYNIDSVEGFLARLDSACTHPESISRSFEYKIDRATRLLMINDGNTMGAAMMPSSFPNAVKLAGMLRSSLSFDKFDIEQLVKLINLEDKDWEQTLLSYQPPKAK